MKIDCMEYKTLYDAERFGALVRGKVEAIGGYRAAEEKTGIKYSTIHAIVMKGQMPNGEHLLRLIAWVKGRKVKY